MKYNINSITNKIINEIHRIHSCPDIKDKVYAIKFDGKRIQFNGKKGWTSIGAAKNAMRLHIGYLIDIFVPERENYNTYQERREIKEQIYQNLLKNRITIEEL